MSGRSTAAVPMPGRARSQKTLVAGALATVALLAIVGVLRQSGSGGGSHAVVVGLSPERTAISRLLGSDQRPFWAVRTSSGLRERNVGQGLTVAYGSSGPLIRSAGGTLGIGLSSVDRGARAEFMQAGAPVAARNRVSYARAAGVHEWYANGPLGLEQGVTVASRPLSGGAGRLRFVFALSGSLRARIDDGVVTFGRPGSSSSEALLRYLGLSVTDARGRVLPAALSVAARRLTISVADARARYPVTVDPTVAAVNLTASNGTEDDVFGSSIAQSASGALVVVGAPNAEVDGSPAGAAYVFARPAAGWAAATQTAELTDSAANGEFGTAVAIVGTTIAVGAPDAEVGDTQEGAVFVYAQPASGWANPGQPVELTASDGASSADFGDTLAAAGTQLFVGAPYADSDTGALYEFTQPSGGWTTPVTQTAELNAPGANDLGRSLAADGTTVVAGATGTTVGSAATGAAFVFTEPATGWGGPSPVPAELSPSGATSSYFGYSVAINAASGTIVVGDRYEGTDNDGAIYVFQEPSGGWASEQQTAEMTPAADDLNQYGSTGLGSSVAITNATGTGPPTPPAGAAADDDPHATPTSAGWSIGVVGTQGLGGVYLFPAANGVWSNSDAGTPVTFGITDASPYSLAVNPYGIVVGQWMGSQMTGIRTGSAYVIPAEPSVKVAGTIYDQQCGEETCRQTGLGDVDVLVKGESETGDDVSETGTSIDDGTWSVNVPPGTYDIGPTTDGSTFAGPIFDPESDEDVDVGPTGVQNENFATCAIGGDDDDTSSRALLASNDGLAPHARPLNSSTYTAALCKSQYTFSLSAEIPGSQIVDPSPNAPYNRSTEKGKNTFPGGTSTLGILFYDKGLDSLFEEYPKYPACEEIYGHGEAAVEEKLEEMAKHGVKMRWYSYMSGGDLGSVTFPLVFNQAAGDNGTVYYGAGQTSETTGELTRVFKYQYVSDPGRTYTCKEEAKISPLAITIPGGADKTGSINENAFTTIVLWYFPFAPSGEVVAPGASAEAIIRRFVGVSEAHEIVETYEHLPWIYRFMFSADLATGGVKALEGAAALSKFVKASESTIKSLETAAEIGEKLHNAHTGFDVGKPSYVNILNLLTGDHYPVMGAVIRGVFKSVPNSRNAKLVSSTTLGLAIRKSDFPDITMHIVRQAKANNDGDCPQSGAEEALPWAPHPVGCVRVWNPYGKQPANMLSVTPSGITRGSAAVSKIVDATRGLDSLADAVKSTSDVFDKLTSIQQLVQPPDCDPDDGPQTQISNTMCWTFEDGRP